MELEGELLEAVEAMESEFVASESEFATELGGGGNVPFLAYEDSEEHGARRPRRVAAVNVC